MASAQRHLLSLPPSPSTPPAPAPFAPGLGTLNPSTGSFDVVITPPTGGGPVAYYQLVVNGHSFQIPAGNPSFSIPGSAGLAPGTGYPVALTAYNNTGLASPTVHSFGTTLNQNGAPLNLLGGVPNFSQFVPVQQNTPYLFSTGQANALSVVDSTTDSQTVTLTPAQGSLSWNTPLPNGVNQSGEGTTASPLVLQGVPDVINQALNGLQFNPENGYTGLASIQWLTHDSVSQLSDQSVIQLQVSSQQAAPPINGLNGHQNFALSPLTTTVGTPILFSAANGNALSVDDANGQNLTLTLTPQNGSVQLSALPPGVNQSYNGNTLTLTGNPYALTNALSTLSFTPSANYAGPASILMVSSDGSLSDSDSLTIQVVQPGNFFQGSLTFPSTPLMLASGSPLTLSQSSQNGLRVSGYLFNDTVTVTLQASQGTLELPLTSNLNVAGQNSSTLTLSGSQAAINNALDYGVVYKPGSATGNATLTMGSTNGNLSDQNDQVPLTISAIPVNRYNNSGTGFPGTGSELTLVNGTPFTFSSANGNALSVQDDGPSLSVTLNPTNGTLGLTNNQPNGVSLTPGANNSLTLSGTVQAVNQALATGLIFTPGNMGPASLSMSSSDSISTDLNDQILMNVLPAPANTLHGNPGFPQTVIPATINLPKLLSDSNGNALGIQNYASGQVDVSLSVNSGTLNLPQTTGLTVGGQNSSTLTLRGTQLQINSALANGLTFTPSANFTGNVNLAMHSSNGSVSDSDGLTLAVSLPPVNQFNGNPNGFPSSASALTVTAGQALTFSGSTAIQITDDSPSVTVTLTSTGGTLQLPSSLPSGVNVQGDGSPASPYQLTGSPANLTQALDGLQFTPTHGGTVSFNVTTSDGSGIDSNDNIHVRSLHNIQLTAPATGITRAVGTPIDLKAKPAITSGQIGQVRVEFLVDGVVVATATTPDSNGVFNAIWDSTGYSTSAAHTVTSRLMDGSTTLASSNSAQVSLIVPGVTLDKPFNNAIFDIGRDPVQLQATITLPPEQLPGTYVEFTITKQETGSVTVVGSSTPNASGVATTTWDTTPLLSGNLNDGFYEMRAITKDSGNGGTIFTSPPRTFELVNFGYTLYGVDNNSGAVYKINTNPDRHPVGTQQALTALDDARNAMDKHPLTGELLYISQTGQLKAYDPGLGTNQVLASGLGSPPRLGTTYRRNASNQLRYYAYYSGSGSTIQEYDITNYSSVVNRTLTVKNASTLANISLGGGGDMAFEPESRYLFIQNDNQLLVGRVLDNSTDVLMSTMVTLNTLPANTLTDGYTSPAGIGFDTINNRLLVMARKTTPTTTTRLYSVNYTKTNLGSGNWGFNFQSVSTLENPPVTYPLLHGDITSAHSSTLPN